MMHLEALNAIVLACSDYSTINASLISDENFQDAVICAYTVKQGLTLPGFAAIIMLGIINLPVYITQESVMGPFVLTLIVGGVLLSSVAGFVQGLAVVLILFVLGLGPVLVFRRLDRG